MSRSTIIMLILVVGIVFPAVLDYKKTANIKTDKVVFYYTIDEPEQRVITKPPTAWSMPDHD